MSRAFNCHESTESKNNLFDQQDKVKNELSLYQLQLKDDSNNDREVDGGMCFDSNNHKINDKRKLTDI